MPNSSSRAAPLAAPSRTLALQWLLPLVITAVVTVVLVAGLAVSAVTLRRAALESADTLLTRGTRQLATVAAANVQVARARYLVAANDVAVRELVRGTSSRARADTVRRTLQHLTTPNDSGMPVELWTADGRRAAFVGNDLLASMDVRRPSEFPDRAFTRRQGLDSLRRVDSVQLGALYESNGRVHFWLVMPIIEDKRAIGYIAQQRRLAAGPQTIQTLRELTGTPITAYYGNVDRRFWSTIGGQPSNGPRASGDDVIAAEARIPGTPLTIALETPRAAVLAAPHAIISRLTLLALALTIAAAALAWLVGRWLARPLALLTRAAESVARGDYAARVPSGGPSEIAQLGTSFNTMSRQIGVASAELQKASRAKSDFLATMSHELRTPLNAIGGYVDLLEMELRGPVTDAQRRDFARIRTNQQHLLGLIGGILDLSRIGSGRIEYRLEPIGVDQFLSGLDALIGPQAESKELNLEYAGAPGDLVVTADREKLRQILLNLLSNAIRHTPSGGRIAMSAAASNAFVEISVRDTGPGIPPEKQAVIFEPFVQLDRSLTQTLEGVGLGLAISRDLAIGMGGALTVESKAGAGACFTLSLPRGTDAITPFLQTGEASLPAVTL